MSIVTIDNATIDSRVFTGYYQESHRILDQIRELTLDYKELVETIAETTKLDKKVVSKYFKSKFKEQTKEAKVLGDMFEKLDEILTT